MRRRVVYPGTLLSLFLLYRLFFSSTLTRKLTPKAQVRAAGPIRQPRRAKSFFLITRWLAGLTPRCCWSATREGRSTLSSRSTVFPDRPSFQIR